MRFEVDVTALAVVLELDTEPANLASPPTASGTPASTPPWRGCSRATALESAPPRARRGHR